MKILSFVFPFLLFLSGNSETICQLVPPMQSQSALVKVPGTKVSLIPPDGLKLSERFSGFWDEETGLSISIMEMPAPYSEIIKGFTKEALDARGMRLLTNREISFNGRAGVLLQLWLEGQSGPVLSWMAAIGNEKETVLVNASFPERMKAQVSSAMEKSALSVQWDAEAKIDPLASLSFSFDEDSALKFAGRVSNTVVLTKDGVLTNGSTADPIFVISSSFRRMTIPDIKEFALDRLTEEDKVFGIAIKKRSDVTIAGLPGNEIIAEAKWKDLPDAQVVIYQVLLLDGKDYFILQGFAPREEQEKYLAIFNRIAKSFRKK